VNLPRAECFHCCGHQATNQSYPRVPTFVYFPWAERLRCCDHQATNQAKHPVPSFVYLPWAEHLRCCGHQATNQDCPQVPSFVNLPRAEHFHRCGHPAANQAYPQGHHYFHDHHPAERQRYLPIPPSASAPRGTCPRRGLWYLWTDLHGAKRCCSTNPLLDKT